MTEQRHHTDEEIDALLARPEYCEKADHIFLNAVCASAIIRQLRQRIESLEARDAREVWEESPNRDSSGRKCTECGFDNRWHGEMCLYQHPSLRIIKAAFDQQFDEAEVLRQRNKELEAENGRMTLSTKWFQEYQKRVRCGYGVRDSKTT